MDGTVKSSMLDKAPPVRRICPVIFLLDTSVSMDGEPIGAVNAAIEGVLPELVALNDENPDNEIQIAIMSFDGTTRWVTGNGLVDPNGYTWNYLYVGGGGTSMGEAFTTLDNALSVSKGFMNHASGSVAPVLFLLSDGEPTDDYQSGLTELKNNNWYKIAYKVAVGYGSYCNDAVLAEFTGNPETVLHTNDPGELKKQIRFTVITSSKVASKNSAAISGNSAAGGAAPAPGNNTAALAGPLKQAATLAADETTW